MYLQHYFSYSLCDHTSPFLLLPCPTSPPPSSLCPRLKRIRTSLSNEFCPTCLLTSHTHQLKLAPSYASYKPKTGIHSYCSPEAKEATAILSRAEEHFTTLPQIHHMFDNIDKRERLTPQIANTVAYLYYLLTNHFWTSLQRGKVPGIAQRILLLGLRGLIENEIRNEKLFVHFPPRREEYIQQGLVVSMDMSGFQKWIERTRVQETWNDIFPEGLNVLITLLGKEVNDMPEGVMLEEFPIERSDFVQVPRKISVWMEMKDVFWSREKRVLADPHDYYGQGGEGGDEVVRVEEYRQGDWVSWPTFARLHPNCR